MRVIGIVLAVSWLSLWFTPDQLGQRQFEQAQFVDAAESFEDSFWQGAAWYRAGEFENALQAFSRVGTPEALFNSGNAWVMLGKYERAVDSYDEAIAARPGWQEAIENRELAIARAKLLEAPGGDMGDQKLGADKIVFDKKKDSRGQDTEMAGEQTTSAESIQAMWLRRVQTQPADFLKAKFAYQLAVSSEESSR